MGTADWPSAGGLSERAFGLETEQKEIQATQAEIPQQEAPQAPQSAGALLKTERERLGLTREQITERTRMRTQVVEAIENEAWDSLPPPVFVRGFLRSYAKVLGVSQDTVIDLYVKLVPPESPGLEPHVDPSRSRRRRAWLVVLILALLAAVYGTWHFYPSLQVNQGSRDTEKRDQEVASAPSEPVVVSPAPVRAAEEPLKQEAAPVQSASQDTPSSQQGGESPARDQANEGDGWLSLTGIVKEKTWLRITIDGKEEKEYLFQPGSRPQWRGKERFYMVIGNAAGIDFDLNGKRLGNLGSPGQVIRLTLPKDVGQREGAN
jgi:cytoskeleton protein RodZ